MSQLSFVAKAVVEGEVRFVQAFLEQRQPKISASELTTWLHDAVEWDRVEIAKILLAAGAPVDGRNELGETPLMHAVCYCTICLEMVNLLIESGADADAENNDSSVIAYACSADTTNAMQSAALEALWRAPRRNREVKRRRTSD